MSRSLRIGLLLAGIGLGTAAPHDADAQPASSASALPPGHPPTDAMPPGHPPTGAMPPGHPPTGAMPPGHPPTSAGAARQADPGFFVPPPNTVTDDPTLPAGTLVVTLRDAEDKPIPGAPIRLDILRRSVSQGDSTEQRSAVADGSGAARFEGLPVGSAIFYQPTTKRGPASFSATPFTLGDKVGKRSVLHAYDATTDVNEAFVLAQGVVFLALREDAIVVEQSFTLGNLSPTAWVADVTVPLPQGFRALNREETEGNLRLDEVNGVGIALRGTVSPGRHDLSFRYNVPLDKRSSQTLRIELPPHVAAMRVFAEAGKSTKLEVVGFPAAKPEELRNGAKVLFTEERAQRGTGGLKPLVINLSGLPTPPPGRWVALGLAITGVLGALAMLFMRRQDGPRSADDETRRELMEARDALLDEFTELERARKRGEIGPKTYARVREGLLDALARIVAMIEDAEAGAAPKQDTPKRGPGGKTTKRKAGTRAAPASGSASAS